MTRIEEEIATLHAVLRSSGKKIGTAESVTVGNIQAKIASMAGASDVFSGGITAYSIEEKVNLLSVDRVHAEQVDCVSERVAGEMASGAAKLFACDLAVATTGYAEPPTYVGPLGEEPKVPTFRFRAYYTDVAVLEVLGRRCQMQPLLEELESLHQRLLECASQGGRIPYPAREEGETDESVR